MTDPFAPLLADGVIDEVCGRLKSGKEADLWLVRHRGEVVAAKVYKAREARSFRNNAGYREGRHVRDTRTQRAMDRGSRFGVAAAEEAWKAKEADALHALHAAGVRVPRPVMYYEGVLLMELVVDSHGRPAPRLVDARVERDQAVALYADLRGQVVRMLGCDLIHGDLSPYNVLLGWNGPVVIDFPQVVGAAHNSQAESFFHRDLENLRRFFAGMDPALREAANDGREIWRAYVRRELTPDFVPTGRATEPARRGGDRHGDRHRHPPAHEAAALRDRARPDRRDVPGGPPPRKPQGQVHDRGDRHGRHGASAPGPGHPERRGSDRRRAAPAPEVVRVHRPPLGAAGASGPASSAATPHRPPASAHGGQQPGGHPGRHGRRRRRR